MRRFVQSCSVISAATVCVALLSQSALGQATDVPFATTEARREARALTKRAGADYRSGRYEAAAAGYQRAHALVPAPQLLFDIGQCHRKLGQPDRAKTFFEAYLRERPDAPHRVVVEQLIAEADAQLREREASPVTVRRVAIEPLRPPPTPVATTRIVFAPSPVDDDDSEAPLLVERWWFWAGVGVVVAGGVTATLLLTREPEDEAPAASLGTVRWH
jgi:hypothetical protein